MARKYSRDNRGRFAGGGGGATARGGRLRTAAGNKRKTQKRIITSKEGHKARNAAVDANDNAAKLNLPTKYGGKGLRNTPKGIAAEKASIAARAARDATIRSAGLPKSGGAMRASVKLKRDSGVGAKLAARKTTAKPSTNAETKRVLVKANARPENLFSRATKSTPGYGTDAKANIANARKTAEMAGAKTALKSNKRSSTVASVNSKTPNQINFNASHEAWKNPRQSAIADRRRNLFSTAKAGQVVAHELGHIKHDPMKMARSFEVQLRKKGQIYADAGKVVAAQRLARRVSQYARTSPAEFAAETRAALSLGKKYDSKVMSLYRQVTGKRLPSVKSQQARQGVSATKPFVSPRAKRRKPS